MLVKLLLATLAFLTITPGHAQTLGDRQRQEIEQGEHCLQQMERDSHGSIALARNMLARENATDTARVMALTCLVRAQLMIGEGEAARTAAQQLLPLLDQSHLPPRLQVEMQLFAATALQQMGHLQQAGDVLESALAQSGSHTNLHIQALVAIALHHARGMRDPATAEPYFQRAIAVTAKRPGGQIPMDALPYFNYGLATLEQGRPDEAAILLEKASDLASRDRHLDRLRGRIDGSLARIALERGDLALARTQFKGALGLQQAMNDTPGVASTLLYLGELALLKGLPAQALEYGQEAAQLAEHGHMGEQVHDSFALMARIHAALGNAAESKAWNDRARQHLAEINLERDPAIAAALEQHAPRPDPWIDQLGSLTRARIISTLALLALAATLLIGGWTLLNARRRQRQLTLASTTDPLTGLINRREASRLLDALPVAGNDRAALLLLDVDQFKSINDEHGHHAGDQVLTALALCLREACDANDVVARWGGEEFLVLRPRTSQAAACALAEHLRGTVAQLAIPLPGGQMASATVSVGLAPCPYFPGHGGWQDAIRMADRALYAAKHSGRNAWAGTWGEAAGAGVDVYSVRQDLEAARARGWITALGSHRVSWSPRNPPRPENRDAFVKPA